MITYIRFWPSCSRPAAWNGLFHLIAMHFPQSIVSIEVKSDTEYCLLFQAEDTKEWHCKRLFDLLVKESYISEWEKGLD